MARTGLKVAACTVAICAAAPAAAAAIEDARPVTIPALRHFRAGEGHLSLRRDARVVFDRGGRGEARTLAGDLARVTGQRVPVKRGAPPRRGDVALEIRGRRSELGREGYRLRIGRWFEIEARHAAGAFYGGQTLVQLLRASGSAHRGLAADHPTYPERGLMIDLGRRRYGTDWIRREIRQLSYLKLNLLHLHLTDDQRWGIESDRHPELTSPGALSKSQIRSLLAFARRRHVTVVPEIDMPGHLGALLAQHPGLALRKPGEPGGTAATRLDVTDHSALRFARSVIAEYLPLFRGRYWHLGADEYLPDSELDAYPQLAAYAQQRYGAGATAKDAVLGFVNAIDRFVSARGRVLRVWSDELGDGQAVEVNPDVVVEWWTPASPLSDLTPPTPPELLAGGHRILNAGWFPTYFTGDIGPIEGKPDMRDAYEAWSVNQFAGPTIAGGEIFPRSIISPSSRRNLGAKINAWENTDLSDSELAEGLLPRLSVLAQKTWGPPLTRSYSAFESIVARIGRAPGANR
ncbi:MAG: family 20 glycosylhydrolase [Solirubrobacterales bacterium]